MVDIMKSLVILLLILCMGIVIYLWAIAPRMFRKPDVKSFYGWLYAHRGLHDNKSDAPENSMKAFSKAVDAGYGIELDIQLTKDNIPVVFHDYTLERICGVDGKVRDYTYQELQQFTLCGSKEHIPKLEEVLRLVAGKIPLIVELKVEWTDLSLCPIGDKILKQYKGQYCIESFNPLAVGWYRKNRPEVVRGQLSEAFLQEVGYKGKLYFFLQNLLMNFISRPDFVAYNHKHGYILSRRICSKFFKSTSVAWTIKNEQELERAKSGFDMFIFDSFIPEINR